MFEYDKSVGLICGDLPFCLNPLGEETFLLCALDNSFVVYESQSLRRTLVSKPLLAPIDKIAAYKHWTFIVQGLQVICFHRVQEIWRLELEVNTISDMKTIGETLFVLSSQKLFILDTSTGHVLRIIANSSGLTSLFHPRGFKNKILLYSSSNLSSKLFNFNSEKVIFEYENLKEITCIEQAPVINIVGFGNVYGQVQVHDLKLDKQICQFQHSDEAKVTSLSFTTSTNDKLTPLMVSSTISGDIVVWNISTRAKEFKIRQAHNGAITRIAFLPTEPVLISSGKDNKICFYLFEDKNKSIPKLIKQRCGHMSPPKNIKFYGKNLYDTFSKHSKGNKIVSVGLHSNIRILDFILDIKQNYELSQKIYIYARKNKGYKENSEVKLGEVISIDMVETRENDWNNIVTVHEGHCCAYLWNYNNKALAPIALRPDQEGLKGIPTEWANDNQIKINKKYVILTCCALTSDGGVAYVGSDIGTVYKFSAQSARLLATFNSKMLIDDDTKVVAVYSDELLKRVFCFHESGLVVAWTENGLKAVKKFKLSTKTLKISIRKGSSVAAVLGNDNKVYAINFHLGRIVRSYESSSKISDIVQSHCHRYIFTSHENAMVSVYDIVLGVIKSEINVGSPCTSLDIHLTGDYLITSHENFKGIKLWRNVRNGSHITFPNVNHFRDDQMEVERVDEVVTEEEKVDLEDICAEIVKLGSGKRDRELTLTRDMEQKWFHLANFDVIKKRNKGIIKEQKAEDAPFFLPNTFMDQLNNDTDIKEKPASKVLSKSNENFLLEDTPLEDNLDLLLSQNLSKIDFQLQTLLFADKADELIRLLKWLRPVDTNFEAKQSILSRLLEIGFEEHITATGVLQELKHIFKELTPEWEMLNENLHKCLSYSTFVTHRE